MMRIYGIEIKGKCVYHSEKFREAFYKQVAKYEKKLTKANKHGSLEKKQNLENEFASLIYDRLGDLCWFEFIDLRGYAKYSINYNEKGQAKILTEFVELGFDGTERHSRDEKWTKERTEKELKTDDNTSVVFRALEGTHFGHYYSEDNLEDYELSNNTYAFEIINKKEDNKIHQNIREEDNEICKNSVKKQENKTSINKNERMH